MNRTDTAIVRKMTQYCEDITLLMNRYNRDFSIFENDIAFQYSCNMCIIQIGELTGRLSREFMEEHAEIPWHAIKAMRNLHAHDYENVDLEVVWDTLQNDIPLLERQLNEMLS